MSMGRWGFSNGNHDEHKWAFNGGKATLNWVI